MEDRKDKSSAVSQWGLIRAGYGAEGRGMSRRGKVLKSKSSLHRQGLDLGDQAVGGVMGRGRELEKKSRQE